MGLILGGASASDLILDGKSVSLYVGGNPPIKVWPTTDVVQITLGAGNQASDQLRAALTDRGLNYQTVTEIPFDIELVGRGAAQGMFIGYTSLTRVPDMDTSQVTNTSYMFYDCAALTHVPDMDTSQVTNMASMFRGCSSLTHVPDMDTSRVATMASMFQNCSSLTTVPDMHTAQVTNMLNMFRGCSSLTDGNVRLIGKHPQVNTTDMILNSGLTREPWYKADGTPLGPRKVTINGSPSGWNKATATGDTGLIQEWFGGNRVRFHTPTKCNQRVYNGTAGLVVVNAGNTIPAGAPIQPISYNGPYTFTEVL